jgi:hypothetical protein
MLPIEYADDLGCYSFKEVRRYNFFKNSAVLRCFQAMANNIQTLIVMAAGICSL